VFPLVSLSDIGGSALTAFHGSVVVAAAEEGFGFNFSILDTNLINLVIIISVLIYFGRGFLGKTLSERRSQIESEIKAAEDRKRKAAASLADAQQKLAQAKAEAERIRQQALESAERAKATILAEAEAEVARMQESASQDITSQQERIARELRETIANRAIVQAENRLKSSLSPDAQGQLVEQSIASLGGRT
jgi:F-type H+-transporting ATPase subunit b